MKPIALLVVKYRVTYHHACTASPTFLYLNMADAQIYEETFNITSVNSQKYDRVARIAGTSSSHNTQMTLDINTELYPIGVGENIQLVLASTLSLDGTKDERGWKDLSRTGESTLADLYDYVCRGKIYRFEEGQGENLCVLCCSASKPD